jgi:hypothetical protein
MDSYAFQKPNGERRLGQFGVELRGENPPPFLPSLTVCFVGEIHYFF